MFVVAKGGAHSSERRSGFERLAPNQRPLQNPGNLACHRGVLRLQKSAVAGAAMAAHPIVAVGASGGGLEPSGASPSGCRETAR